MVCHDLCESRIGRNDSGQVSVCKVLVGLGLRGKGKNTKARSPQEKIARGAREGSPIWTVGMEDGEHSKIAVDGEDHE
jgi:hypothetical protein